MKKVLVYSLMLIATILFVASTSCISSQSPLPVRGVGDLKDKTYDIANFNGVDISGGFDVNLIQGDKEGLVLTAEENLFEYINVKVEAGILKVYVERNNLQTRGLKAKVYLKSITSLQVSGGGDVTAENGLDVPNLDVQLSGGGDLKTTLKTGELKCRISGGGDAEIEGTIAAFNLNMSGGGDISSNVNAKSINCSISGGGDVSLQNKEKATNVDFNISGGGDLVLDVEADDVKCSVSGGGDASLSGKAKTLDVAVNGGGDVNAGKFEADKASFRANGGSDIHVRALSELSGNISGGGNVYYSGNPSVVNIDAKGGSTVHKE